MLSDQDLLLYNRQIALNELGPRGQERLQQGSVAVVGLGGLGSSAAIYAAVAGLGRLILIDHDQVSLSNLQRQILHTREDLKRDKTASAADRLHQYRPEIELTLHQQRLSADNGEEFLAEADFVIDATDTSQAKFLLAETCHHLNKPYSHAGVYAFQGQTMTVLPGRTACCRCLFTRNSEALEDAHCTTGIVGAVPGIIGSVQALEAIKYITGAGELLTDRMLIFKGLEAAARTVRIKRNPQCPLCA